jgi:hypothetical protein
VYELGATGREVLLYSFKGGAGGANLYGDVTRDSAGYLCANGSVPWTFLLASGLPVMV